ncbi:hypothetical protein ABT336_06790 [Micromonospora sp. NPDC000207]|uniref:hypothetical protein n=1 Tax=Micromonospora sp. NPDC000207 TaxID=3154246 RepID=UPI00331B0097
MFIDIYFMGNLHCEVDRDDVEDALQVLDAFEAVRAGVSDMGSIVDLEADLSVFREEALAGAPVSGNWVGSR